MIRAEYVFTILFLALGPLRTIPVFHQLTRASGWRYRARAAVLATLMAGAIIALVAVWGVQTVESWGVSVAALDIARQMNFFEYMGVKVKFTELAAGSTALQALLGGSVDLVDSASVEMAASTARGADVRAIQNTSMMTLQVCVRKDWAAQKGVTASSDLKARVRALDGAKIAISGPGSASNRTMRATSVRIIDAAKGSQGAETPVTGPMIFSGPAGAAARTPTRSPVESAIAKPVLTSARSGSLAIAST